MTTFKEFENRFEALGLDIAVALDAEGGIIGVYAEHPDSGDMVAEWLPESGEVIYNKEAGI